MFHVRNVLDSNTLLLVNFPFARVRELSPCKGKRVGIHRDHFVPRPRIKNRKQKNIKLMHASGYHESNVCVSGGACGPPFSLKTILPVAENASVIVRVVLSRQACRRTGVCACRYPRPAVCGSQQRCEPLRQQFIRRVRLDGAGCLPTATGLAAGEAVGEKGEESDNAL
jgi:hypothetical protein